MRGRLVGVALTTVSLIVLGASSVLSAEAPVAEPTSGDDDCVVHTDHAGVEIPAV